LSAVSPLKSQAWGFSLIQADVLRHGDTLQVSVRQPLRVTSGTAQLAVTGVDDRGYPVTTFEPVSLAPSGHETDVSLGYAAPMSDRLSLRSSLAWRSDADNVAGRDDLAVKFGFTAAF